MRFVSLPHSEFFWDLNITFKYFLCLKKKNSQQQCTFFKLEIISDKSGYQKLTRGYLLRNYVVNV